MRALMVGLNIPVQLLYTNYKGETAWRTVIPVSMYFGSTEYHPDRQLLMLAYDIVKEATRTFAVGDIKGWKEIE